MKSATVSISRNSFFQITKWCKEGTWLHKGQLISKGLFGFFNSPQKWTKNFCPSRLGQKLTCLSSFLGELKTLKFLFKINWPLALNERACWLSVFEKKSTPLAIFHIINEKLSLSTYSFISITVSFFIRLVGNSVFTTFVIMYLHSNLHFVFSIKSWLTPNTCY